MKSTILLTITICLSAIGYGFTVDPMVSEFDPNAPQSQEVFVLENKSNKDTPVEVVVVKPIIGEDGGEVLEMGNGEDLFLILPQQLVLPANSKRSVKVLYVGDPM